MSMLDGLNFKIIAKDDRSMLLKDEFGSHLDVVLVTTPTLGILR